MITLAYDETTGFESIQKDKAQAIMLAGIVYKDEGEKKYKGSGKNKVEPERARIVAYLRKVCKKAGGSFPRDLHSRNEDNKKQNEKVARVKKELSRTLPEFIKKGTYAGKELIFASQNGKIIEESTDQPIIRQGNYQIIAVYKSEKGKPLSDGSKKDLQDNDVASNLYLNMAEAIINKGVFLNPSLFGSNEEVVFDLPTRVIGKPKPEDGKEKEEQYENLKKEYTKLGYEHVTRKKEDGSWLDYWRIMSPGHAQQIIKQADMVRHVNVNRISIESINYDDVSKTRQYAFLYLSDCICNYLDYQLKEDFVLSVLTPDVVEQLPSSTKGKLPKRNRGDAYPRITITELNNADVLAIASVVKKDLNEEYAKRIRARMRELNNGSKNMFYYYDAVDTYYEKALISVLQGNLYETLSAMYDGRQLNKGYVKRYYTKKWFPVIEGLFVDRCNRYSYQEALSNATAYRVTDNISQGRLFYIYKTLEQNKNCGIDKATEYRLYDLGISAYTHIGNPYKAEECFEKCLKLSAYVEDSDLRASKNRMITVYNDQLRFKDAEAMAAGTLEVNIEGFNQRSKSGIRRFAKYIKSLFGYKTEERTIDRIAPPTARKTSYKGWSSLGQVYAFERVPESEECFIKALDVLKDEKSSDYYITLSYLLQLYIENGEQTKYEEYAKDYFNGETDIEKQLDYLIEEGSKPKNPRFSLKYALFLYIKAFYMFYKNEGKYQRLLRKLTHIDDTVRNQIPSDNLQESLLTGHPWEIIFKYSSLLEAYDTEGSYDSHNRRMIKESVKTEKAFIIDRVLDFGDIEYRKQKVMLHPEHHNYVKNYEKSVCKLWKIMVDSNCITDNAEASILKKEEILSSCFTYMYH